MQPPLNGGTITVGGRELTLSKCGECCEFALCRFCLEKDRGRSAVDPDSVYQALQDMAIDLANRRASIACWFGGKGHLCGIPSVSWNHELGPKAYKVSEFARIDHPPTEVRPGTLVVHPGARLRVSVAEELQSILTQDECKQIQVDEVKEQGATCDDIVTIRSSISRWSNSPLFPKTNRHCQKRFPNYSTRCGEQPEAYITMKLRDYSVEGSVFELGASFDDGDY